MMGRNHRVERRVKIKNRRGIHARAAARFVELASNFKARIEVESKYGKADGKSIMGMLTLCAGEGNYIKIKAEGSDAYDAISALVELINSRFGEEN